MNLPGLRQVVAPPALGGEVPVHVEAWIDALSVAAVFAVAPVALGGVAVRCGAGPVRDRWLEALRSLLSADAPLCRMPVTIADERLLGGLDLPATLRSGRPIAQRGLLAQADGGVLIVPMAERVNPATAARIAAAMDTGEVALAREGVSLISPARFGVIALDEGMDDDEQLPTVLADRMAFHLDLSALSWRDARAEPLHDRREIEAARARCKAVAASDEVMQALAATAAALGIAAPRALWLALVAARAAAALAGRTQVSQADAELAARLVLAPRALVAPPLPESAEGESEPPPPESANAESDSPPPEGSDPPADPGEDEAPAPEPGVIEDQVIAAAQAAICAGLLARLQAAERGAGAARTQGRSGALQASHLRGRPAGVLRGEPKRGARLNLIETLRAAAPWQKLRRPLAGATGRVVVQPEDFRVTRFKQRRRTTTVFCLDASGSAALHRLAEAKGAIELLLADCYVRRDQVAVLAFRGPGAELLLPATRSLVRAKRSLAGLPGGGGTPLAAGMDAAFSLADSLRRRGDTPLVVLLTDGRANIARDGTPDRARAESDALQAAARWPAAGFAALVIDTSARPEPRAQALAQRMHARYLPLPYAQAATLSQAVRSVAV